MHKKNIIFIICLTTIVVLSGCKGNNKQIEIQSKESSKTSNVDNKNSYSSAKVGQGDDEVDLGDGEDNILSDFGNMIDTDDIKSIDDITDDMIINKQGAYFEHSSNNSNGDCLELDYEGFTGIYRWCTLNIKKKASITVNIEGTIEENTRLVLVQNNKSIKEIENGDKVTLDKGESKIVLCGYKAKGNLKIKLAYDKKKISISSSKL